MLINGTSDDDALFGTGDNDQIYGFDGDDRMLGAEGNDYLSGGAGDDIMRGDSGNDTLLGGDGNDYSYAGTGNDFIDGGSGINRVTFFAQGVDNDPERAGRLASPLNDFAINPVTGDMVATKVVQQNTDIAVVRLTQGR